MTTFHQKAVFGVKHIAQWGRLIALSSLISSLQSYALEAEPDWAKRFEEVKREELAAFKMPVIGDPCTVIRRVGGKLSGRVTGITSNSITLNGITYRAIQLTPESCETIYPGQQVERAATMRILTEQQDYQIRKEGEVVRLKDEALKLEQAHRNAEEQARLAQQLLVARQNRDNQKRDEDARSEKKALVIKAGLVLLLVVGLILYIKKPKK